MAIKIANTDVIDNTRNLVNIVGATITGDVAVNGGDITTTSATASVFNTNATTVNIANAATTLSIGANAGTMTIGSSTLVGTQATQNVFNTTATTVNIAGAGTAVSLGATTGTTSINNATVTFGNATAFNINGANPTIASTSTGTLTLFNTALTTVNAFGAATTIEIGAANSTADFNGRLQRSGNSSFAAWTTQGPGINSETSTYTDTTTAAAGTVATRGINTFNTPTIASTNAITVTDAATLYISAAPTAGTNTTITNSHALWVDNGNTRLDGNVSVGGTITGNGSGLTNLNATNIATGTIANARTTGTSANTANTLVLRDATGNFSAGTITAALTGNASTATNLSTNRTNWVTNNTITAVVGQLAWQNFGNNHTIFDASNSTSPSGTAVNNTNSQIAWSATYPTLMGWNGAETYGVRVDSARVADTAANGITSTGGAAPYYGARAWVNFDGTTGAIRASVNSTVTRVSAGVYTVNFTTAMQDANFSVAGVTGVAAAATRVITAPFTYTTTSFNFSTRQTTDGSVTDNTFVNVVFFR